jgi:hypothetical protein
MALCERCEKAPGNFYDETRDMWLCDSCETTMNEQAHERMLDRYYGGSQCQSINEQYHQADEAKEAGLDGDCDCGSFGSIESADVLRLRRLVRCSCGSRYAVAGEP